MDKVLTEDRLRADPQDIDRRSTQYTDLLLECIQQRLELARNLRQLNHAQAAVASSGETDALLSILSRKQSLLESLNALQQRMLPYQDDIPQDRVWATTEHRLRCQEMAAEGGRILAEAMQLEQNTLEEFTARREAIAAQLRDGSDAISARNAYAANDQITGSVLDIGGV